VAKYSFKAFNRNSSDFKFIIKKDGNIMFPEDITCELNSIKALRSRLKELEEQNNKMRKSFICNKCGAADKCKYAWDGYNLGHDGDICLAEK
jgi:hypothetical protein